MQTTIPITVIELEENSYHIMIEAIFNETPSSLIIDTGASKTVFDTGFTETLVTDVEDVEDDDSSGINAMITQTKIGVLPFFKVGELETIDFKCVLLDLSHINILYQKHVDKKISGLIGSDFLVKYNAVIDYGKSIMILNF